MLITARPEGLIWEMWAIDLLDLVGHVKISPRSTYENGSENDRLLSPLLYLRSEVVKIAESLAFVSMSRDHGFVLKADANATQVRTFGRVTYLTDQQVCSAFLKVGSGLV